MEGKYLMAKNDSRKRTSNNPKQKRTSIGRSKQARPKNKHKRKNHKKYRGQG